MHGPWHGVYLINHQNELLCISGESFRSLAMQFRLGETTIGRFIPQVCAAIYKALSVDYLKVIIQILVKFCNVKF